MVNSFTLHVIIILSTFSTQCNLVAVYHIFFLKEFMKYQPMNLTKLQKSNNQITK